MPAPRIMYLGPGNFMFGMVGDLSGFQGNQTVPTKTQLSNFLGTPGEDYFKGNPKSLNFYFLVIWWGKQRIRNIYPPEVTFRNMETILSTTIFQGRAVKLRGCSY